jgi:hypothetical protein
VVTCRGECALGSHARSDVTTDSLNLAPAFAGDDCFAPCDPAFAVACSYLLVVEPRAVSKNLHVALLHDCEAERLSEQASALVSEEMTKRIVCISEPPVRSPPQDQIALRFQQATRLFRAFAQFPILIGELVKARLQLG